MLEALFGVKPVRASNFFMSVCTEVVSYCGVVCEGDWDGVVVLTSDLDLNDWHIAQRMSTSRAERPTSLVVVVVVVALLAMVSVVEEKLLSGVDVVCGGIEEENSLRRSGRYTKIAPVS